MKPKISKLKLGSIYGENEIKHLDNYKAFYYDLNNSLERILNPQKYVVIGRKGTGKTLLAHVVCDNLKESHAISAIESLKDFVFHELSHIEGNDISSTKYVPIFEWMLFINIAKHIINNPNKFPTERVEVLIKFLRYFGHHSGELKVEKTIELTRKFKDDFEGSLKFFDFGVKGKTGVEETLKESAKTYLECIESLKSFITDTLALNESKVLIFYDELDDKFADNNECKDGIVSFLSAVEKVNNHFDSHKLPVKMCAVIRNDIVEKLASANINRIFEDNSIFLSWDAECPDETELFEMLAHKIRQSDPYYLDKSTDNILKEVIPERISGEYFKVYIIHRTLGRPRDIIRMFSHIQESFGNNIDRFEGFTFEKSLKDYSNYLKREIKYQLIGHVENDKLNNYFAFLSSIGKRSFTFEAAKKKNDKNNFFESNEYLKKMIYDLFRAGAICNVVRRSKQDGGNVYYWSYIDESLTANLDFSFEIHPGLWHSLQIPIPKYRFD